MADRIGQQLGGYRLLRLLGRGGFADVYLGEHVYLETQAAIKVLQSRLAEEDTEPFRIEARTLARLEHPHIVRILNFGVEESTPFLVMSYAPGGTLRQHHPKGTRLSLPLVVSYVKQVASALQYAHEEKLIHRDVKPGNMLLGRNGEVLLSDFGIALVTQTSRDSLVEAPMGTVAYMAPEQIRGKPRQASDQYSLGVVVYEWLSGTLPFAGSVFEVFGQHLHVSPTPLQEKISGIPSAVEQVVMRTLAKDPGERFATVQAFATALEQASQVERATGTLPMQRDESLLPTSIPSGPMVPGTFLLNQQVKPLLPPVRSSSRVLVDEDPTLPLLLQTRPPVNISPIPSAPPKQPAPLRSGTRSFFRSRIGIFLILGVLIFLILFSFLGGEAISQIQVSANHAASVQATANARVTADVQVTAHARATADARVTANARATAGPLGNTWAAQTSGTSKSLHSVAWSGSEFVAVGDSGTILTSLDGRIWTAQTSGTSTPLYGVSWSGSQFVVVGGAVSGPGASDEGIILTSPDGNAWTIQTSSIPHDLSGVSWSGSEFVAVGDSGTILTSLDGRTWTAQTSGTPNPLYGVAWLGSRFVAVGDFNIILTSPNGRTWTAQTSAASPTLYGVAWSGSRFVVVGDTRTILTSPDGNTWTAPTSGTWAYLVGIAWSGLRFVAVGLGGTILTSPDGNTWAVQTSGTSHDLYGVAWVGSRFVAVGDSGTILTSS